MNDFHLPLLFLYKLLMFTSKVLSLVYALGQFPADKAFSLVWGRFRGS